MSAKKITIEYDDDIVRKFLLVTILWGLVGMSAGVLIALQLNFPALNFGIEYSSFGRLRPLHTNAAIFAFVGNMVFAGVYYSTQRLCKVRMASRFLSLFHFWGWQAIIVAAAITLPLGLTRSKEYAELIWPINMAVVVIWVIFAVNFFWTLGIRREKTLYVALWFYIATIVTVAMLYIVNHLSIPTSWTHSYPVFGGVQDALVQWWYGHNAVAFFLTTPILGIMYYFLPKAAGRPVYSYRLSIIHFWALIFVYIWAGPHHLLNTALPDWLQILGMVFSLMLWAPSWGGMLNGLLTLRGAWDKLRTEPVIKFFVAALTFYGMATFEGPLLSIKSVSALAHYTDWIIGHVHGGTLGWNGFMAAGMIYWLAPRLWKTELYSKQLANFHFWIGMIGILLYVASMWVSGITQGLLLNETAEGGTILANNNFVNTLEEIRFFMLTRAFGGFLYLIGFGLLTFNVYKTIKSGKPHNATAEVYENETTEKKLTILQAYFNAPTFYSLLLVFVACLWMFSSGITLIISFYLFAAVTLLAVVHFKLSQAKWSDWFDRLLYHSSHLTILSFVAVAIGGAVQIIPTVLINKDENIEDRLQKVYTPLELAGRDIYVSEGCYNCHSQMIRTLLPDVMRYGDYSRLGESVYDHPYQWGSRRIGPDLSRVGGKYGDIWHYNHMWDPRDIDENSNMPSYEAMFSSGIDYQALPKKISVLSTLGVPFKNQTDEEIIAQAKAQAKSIEENLRASGARTVQPDTEIIALIAYLQQLGDYVDVSKTSAALTK